MWEKREQQYVSVDAVRELLRINWINANELAHCSGIPPIQLAIEFRTVRLDLGRCSGLTTVAMQLCREVFRMGRKPVYFTMNHSSRKHAIFDAKPPFIMDVLNERSVDNLKGFQRNAIDFMVVDNASLYDRKLIDYLYAVSCERVKQYLFIG